MAKKKINITDYQKSTGKINQHLISSAQYAQKLTQSLIQGNQQAKEIPENIKKWALGLQGASKQIGGINDQVVDFSKNLTIIKKDYKNLQGIGKKWLSSVNFDAIYDRYNKSLTNHRGVFSSVYGSLNKTMVDIAKNANNLGSDNFNSMTFQLKNLDDEIENVSNTINKLFYDKRHTKDVSLKKDIDERVLRRKKQLQAITEIRNEVYQLNKLQVTLNQKLVQPFQKLDKAGEKLNDLKSNFSTMISTINIAIPGLKQAFDKFDFDDVFSQIKKNTSESLMQVSLGFIKISDLGKASFKSMFKNILLMTKSTGKAMILVFDRVFKVSAIAGLAAIGGMIKSSFDRLIDLQDTINSIMSNSNLLHGIGVDIQGVWQSMGGFVSNVSIDDLTNEMIDFRDITAQAGKYMHEMQRTFSIASKTSSKFLANMKYIYNASTQTTKSLTEMVSLVSINNGLRPQQVFQQMADASANAISHLGKTPEVLAKSVIFAKKLGLTLDDLAGVSQTLWDFQGSIEKSLQIYALTGIDAPIQEMMTTAFDGDPTKALQLALESYGDRFTQFHPFIQKKISELVGLDTKQFAIAANLFKKGSSGVDIQKQLQDGTLGMNESQISAHNLLNTFEAISQVIKNSVFTGFKPLVQYFRDFLNNESKMKKLSSSIENFTSQISNVILSILENKDLLNKTADSLKSISKVLLTIFNIVMKTYDKFGIGGLVVIGTIVSATKALVGAKSVVGSLVIGFTTLKNTINALKISKLKDVGTILQKAKTGGETSSTIGDVTKDITKGKITPPQTGDVAKDITKGGIKPGDVANQTKQFTNAGANAGKGAMGLQDIANATIKFAAALVLLSGSLWIISKVAQGGNLWQSVAAMGALVGVIALLALTSKIGSSSLPGMLAMAGAITILSGALWIVGQIDTKQLWSSIAGITAMIAVLAGAAFLLGTFAPVMAIGMGILIGLSAGLLLIATSFLVFSTGINVVADSLIKITTNIDFKKFGTDALLFAKGVLGLAGAALLLIPTSIGLGLGLGALWLALKAVPSDKGLGKLGTSLKTFSDSIIALSSAQFNTGIDNLQNSLKRIDKMKFNQKKIKLSSQIQSNSLVSIKSNYEQNKQQKNKNNQILEYLKKIVDRPIQLTVNLDGKRVAKQIQRHTSVSQVAR